MVGCGFLLHLGYFSFWPVYLLLVLGDFAADLGWYAMGYFGGNPAAAKWGHMLGLTPEVMEKLEKMFHRHQGKILVISKLTMGFGFALATLVAAGLVRVPFKKYAAINFFGGFLWTGFLISLGYFFGNLYSIIDKSFKWAFAVFIIVIVLLALRGFSKYFKQKLIKNEL